MHSGDTWQALGAHSHMLRSSAARALVNIGLVVGTERALVVDTGTGPRHGAEILAAVRTVTGLPLVVVNTHAHWDHFFGTAVLKNAGVTDFWAHAGAARAMAVTGESQRAEVAGPEPEMAARSGKLSRIVLPNRLVGIEVDTGLAADHAEPEPEPGPETVVLDLGGVVVELFSLGPAHTRGDLMVGVPGEEGIPGTPGTPPTSAVPGVLFAGDVLEEGAPPSVEPESNVPGWIASLNRLATMGEKYVIMVPGHGSPVSADFAAAMAVRLEATQRT